MFNFIASSCRSSVEGKAVRAYTSFKTRNCSASARFLFFLGGGWSEEMSDAGGWREYGEVVWAELLVVVRSTETGPRRMAAVDGEAEVLTGTEKRGSGSIPWGGFWVGYWKDGPGYEATGEKTVSETRLVADVLP